MRSEEANLGSMAAFGGQANLELSPTSSRLLVRERLHHSIQRHRLSTKYVVLCGTMALLGIVLVVFTFIPCKAHMLGEYPRELWFLLVEALLTVFIIFETLGDRIIRGSRDYWKEPWHFFDFIVCVVCVFILAVDIAQRIVVFDFDDYIGVALIIMRNLVQGCRAVRLLRNLRKARAVLNAVNDTSIILPS